MGWMGPRGIQVLFTAICHFFLIYCQWATSIQRFWERFKIIRFFLILVQLIGLFGFSIGSSAFHLHELLFFQIWKALQCFHWFSRFFNHIHCCHEWQNWRGIAIDLVGSVGNAACTNTTWVLWESSYSAIRKSVTVTPPCLWWPFWWWNGVDGA